MRGNEGAHTASIFQNLLSAGLPASGTGHISSFGGKALDRNNDVIRCPPLGLVRRNHVAMAPLPKIAGTYTPSLV